MDTAVHPSNQEAGGAEDHRAHHLHQGQQDILGTTGDEPGTNCQKEEPQVGRTSQQNDFPHNNWREKSRMFILNNKFHFIFIFDYFPFIGISNER